MLDTLKDVGLLLSLATNVFLIWFIARRPAAGAGSSPAAGSPPAPPRPISGDALAGVREQLRAGNKIHAIKLYREATGSGLLEAKNAVEAMERT